MRAFVLGVVSISLGSGVLAGCTCGSDDDDDDTQPPPDAAVDAGEPEPDAETPPVSAFPFLDHEGPAAEAMQSLYADAQIAGRTQEEADARLGRLVEARRALAEHRAEAQAELLEALLPLTVESYAELVLLGSLLEEIGDSPEILGHMHGLVMGPLTPEERGSTGHGVVPLGELGRGRCMAVLAYHARAGSETARELALQAAASPSMDVRAAAVQVTLETTRNRRLSQRALRELLPAENHYLVYQY